MPKKQDFSRNGLKRPRPTSRAVLVAAIFGVLVCVYLVTSVWLVLQLTGWLVQLLVFLLAVFLLLILLPALVLLAVYPTTLIARMRTTAALRRAKAKFTTAQPLVIGITGSYGKTATKLLLTHILSQQFKVFTTPKSYNTPYSVARSIEKHYSGEEIAIIEYGAYGVGEIARLTHWIAPQHAVITGMVGQHLGLFGGIDAIIQAKTELIMALPQDGKIFYADWDEGAQQIVTHAKGLRPQLEYVPASSLADQFGQEQLSPDGQLAFEFAGQHLQTQLVGMHYRSNIRLAVAVALQLGVKPEKIAGALESFVPNDNFIHVYRLASGALVVDDGGSANPKGFAAALDLLSTIQRQRKIVITPGIVDLGAEEQPVHGELAEKARLVAQQIWHVGESGREAFVQVFGADCLFGREEIEAALSVLQANDVLLIEGRMPGWVTAALSKLR